MHTHTPYKRASLVTQDFGDGIIDIYSTNLVDIPLSEQEEADAAYYDRLADCLR